MISVVRPAWKDEIVQRTASTLQPLEQARSCWFKQFKLNRPSGLLLDDDGALSHTGTAHELADPDLHEIAATQLTVDC
jgi:hypothetical protein